MAEVKKYLEKLNIENTHFLFIENFKLFDESLSKFLL